MGLDSSRSASRPPTIATPGLRSTHARSATLRFGGIFNTSVKAWIPCRTRTGSGSGVGGPLVWVKAGINSVTPERNKFRGPSLTNSGVGTWFQPPNFTLLWLSCRRRSRLRLRGRRHRGLRRQGRLGLDRLVGVAVGRRLWCLRAS